MTPRSDAILAGVIWGTSQAALLLLVAEATPAFAHSTSPDSILVKILLQMGIISVGGLFTGYVLGEAQSAGEALLVSQLLASPVIVAVLSIFPPPSLDPFQIPVALAYLPIIYFLFALAGVLPGGFIGEWFRSMSILSMDWRFCVGSTVLMMPVFLLSLLSRQPTTPLDYHLNPTVVGDWNTSLALSLLLIASSILLSVVGLYGNRALQPYKGGLLLILSIVTLAVAILFLNYANTFYDPCVNPRQLGLPPCEQEQQFLDLLLVVGASLLAPGVTIFGFLIPKYWSSSMKVSSPPG